MKMKNGIAAAALFAVLGCGDEYTERRSDCSVSTDCGREFCTDVELCWEETLEAEVEPDDDYNERYRYVETETATLYPRDNPADRTVVEQVTYTVECNYSYDVDFDDIEINDQCTESTERCIAAPGCHGNCPLQCTGG